MKDLSDSILHNVLSTIFDMILVNLCFLLCCLPVITIGTAVSALYISIYHLQIGEGHVIRTFWGAFQKALRSGIRCWLIWLALFTIAAADFLIIGLFWHNPVRYILLGILLGMMILLLIFGSALFSTLSFYSSIKSASVNAFRLGVGNLFRFIPVCFLFLTPALLLLFWTYGFLLFMAVFLLIWFSLSAYLSLLLLKSLFTQHLGSI